MNALMLQYLAEVSIKSYNVFTFLFWHPPTYYIIAVSNYLFPNIAFKLHHCILLVPNIIYWHLLWHCQFVSSALKEQSLEFELLQPAMPRRRVIPRFPRAGQKTPTLNEEELVPSALVKFKPIETDSIVFTGLCNELLLASEPLTAATGVVLP